MTRRFLTMANCVGILLSVGLAAPARAQNPHVTDGTFTSPQEWDPTRPTVSRSFFAPASDGSGNAWLYVEHFKAGGGTPQDTLYLMYDYVGSHAVANPANSFFDVFFEVNGGKNPNDYIVRFNNSGFNAFERPHGNRPPFNPDGSFDLGPTSGWSALTTQDLALANFHAQEGLGSSPNLTAPHLMAEFDLTVGEASNNGNGIYDPAPAFWSASKGGNPDPPITSGIFSLNPNGTTTVVPVLGPNGGPARVPSDIPEPGGLALLAGLAVSGLTLLRRRRA
jgi:hypothetical protein